MTQQIGKTCDTYQTNNHTNESKRFLAQAIRKAIRSALSFADGMPANAIALPGAKPEGF